MPAQLAPPSSLSHLRYFLVRLDREVGRYELIEPNRAQTYDLGDAFQARAYLEKAAGEYLGGRALDSATAFGVSQAIPRERRAFGLDLCQLDGDFGLKSHAATADTERLLGEEYLDREIILDSGVRS